MSAHVLFVHRHAEDECWHPDGLVRPTFQQKSVEVLAVSIDPGTGSVAGSSGSSVRRERSRSSNKIRTRKSDASTTATPLTAASASSVRPAASAAPEPGAVPEPGHLSGSSRSAPESAPCTVAAAADPYLPDSEDINMVPRYSHHHSVAIGSSDGDSEPGHTSDSEGVRGSEDTRPSVGSYPSWADDFYMPESGDAEHTMSNFGFYDCLMVEIEEVQGGSQDDAALNQESYHIGSDHSSEGASQDILPH